MRLLPAAAAAAVAGGGGGSAAGDVCVVFSSCGWLVCRSPVAISGAAVLPGF